MRQTSARTLAQLHTAMRRVGKRDGDKWDHALGRLVHTHGILRVEHGCRECDRAEITLVECVLCGVRYFRQTPYGTCYYCGGIVAPTELQRSEIIAGVSKTPGVLQ